MITDGSLKDRGDLQAPRVSLPGAGWLWCKPLWTRAAGRGLALSGSLARLRVPQDPHATSPATRGAQAPSLEARPSVVVITKRMVAGSNPALRGVTRAVAAPLVVWQCNAVLDL